MALGWFRRVAAIAGCLTIALAFTPGRGSAATAPLDLAASAGCCGSSHFTEGGFAVSGGTGVVFFGYQNSRSGVTVTIDVDISGLPASIQPVGNPVFYASTFGACTWWSGHTGFTCAEPSVTGGNGGALNVTAPLGSAGATGTYRVTVHSNVEDPNPANNSASHTLVVDRAPRTDLALSFTPGAAAVGQVASVRMAVTDNGPDGPVPWSLHVSAPSGTQYLGCQPVACDSGLTVDVGKTVEITLSFRVDSSTIGDGSWSIQPDNDRLDPVPANDVMPRLGSLIHVLPAGPVTTAQGPAGSAAPVLPWGTGAGTDNHGTGQGDGTPTLDPVTGLPIAAASAAVTPSVSGAGVSASGTASAGARALSSSDASAKHGPTGTALAVVVGGLLFCLVAAAIAWRRRSAANDGGHQA